MDPAIQKVVQEAYRLLEGGDREGARATLTAAIRDYPREAQLWYWLGRALDNRGHAIDALKRALKYDPKLREAQIYLDELEQQAPRPLNWLFEEEEAPPARPAPAPAPEPEPEPEESWSFLLDEEKPSSAAREEPRRWSFMEEEPAETGSPAATASSEWSVREELEEEPTAPSTPAGPGQSVGQEWSILEELESEGPSSGASAPATEESGEEWSFLSGTESTSPVASAPAQEPSDAWAFLDEGGSDTPYDSAAAPTPPTETPEVDTGGWSLLDELDSGSLSTGASAWEQAESGSTDTRMEDSAGGMDDLWNFLEEESSAAPRAATPSPSPQGGASTYTPASSESEIWQRAEPFIGAGGAAGEGTPTVGPTDGAFAREGMDEMAPDEGLEGVPERGAFSFMDAPPSPASNLPVRNSFAPLTAEQILEVVGAPPQTAKKEQEKKGKGKEEKKEKESRPKGEGGSRALGCVRQLLVAGVVLLLLAVGGWFALQNADSIVPESMLADNPPVATAIAVAQIRTSLSAPTPLPLPDWVQQAEEARYANDRQQAETLLRDGLGREPQNVTGLVTLSSLKREQPGGEQEALALAQQALDVAATLEDRALAAEAFVWAMDRQPMPDVGNALARAEQAVAETPRSPHAYWARAIATAMNGEIDFARESATLAAALTHSSQSVQGDATMARFYARINEPEQAVGLYESALEEYDYVPWRVELVQLLRTLERTEEAQSHLEHLREIAPDDPAVQGLGQ